MDTIDVTVATITVVYILLAIWEVWTEQNQD